MAGKTFPITKNFDSTKRIGIVILDDETKIELNDILSVEFVTTKDKKLKLDSFSIIDGAGYCQFREKAKEEIEKMKGTEIVMDDKNQSQV